MIIALHLLVGDHVGILLLHCLAIIVAQEDVVDSLDLIRVIL